MSSITPLPPGRDRAPAGLEPTPPPEPATRPDVAPDPSTTRKRIGGALAAVVAVLAKFKGLLLLLPKIKLLTTAGSMLVSIAAYGLIWGWRFGAGVVGLLFFHELGHWLWLKREGIQPKALVFVPFLGAYVSSEANDRDAGTNARVALAGPILGSLAALVLVGVWQATDYELWRALAFFGFFINLFNLVPFGPLDGGQATEALPWKAWIPALIAVLAMAALFPSTVAIIFLVTTAYKLYATRKHRKPPRFGELTPRGRILVTVAYVALVVVLAVATNATHITRTFADA